MNRRKSQVAVEFLVTYGWAILTVIVAVGVLIYFGIFNTTRYVNDRCNFGQQLVCEDYILNQHGNISIMLRNNFGVPIDITNIMIRSSYDLAKTCNPAVAVKPGPNAISQYSSVNITCNIGISSLPENEQLEATIIIGFRRSGGVNNPLHNQTGELLLTSQIVTSGPLVLIEEPIIP